MKFHTAAAVSVGGDLIMIWKLISLFVVMKYFCCDWLKYFLSCTATVKWTISIKSSWQKLLAVISWGIKSIIVKVLDGKLVRVVRRDKGCSKLSASATIERLYCSRFPYHQMKSFHIPSRDDEFKKFELW